ncbi:MAG: fibrillarin-like rRNA/tRNA 2'-O-methyltransferase [Candidatus Marsarchaeota archaeon]|nr:fibrillarin-like rRNA/tRNA 2'-O-methyltransferase [Candidatus Marsarchaeota archaeon]MCL5007340.1 fibrillarin-like rRNA/tRNA 2'-O-methyltransferase [Candidatus Marsarchaeota archaeon]
MDPERLFDGVYRINGRLFTKNITPGYAVYGEELVDIGGEEYRGWNPYRSKLAAAIMNGLKEFHFGAGKSVLYIGGATGTTVSHVSDIVGGSGRVYCVELSERNMRELVKVCERKGNILPILADAGDADTYSGIVGECGVIYQDASARDQAALLLANSRFLSKGGYAYFAIKSQSIDISRKPSEVFKEELKKLSVAYDLIETVAIEPYDMLHMFAVLRKR